MRTCLIVVVLLALGTALPLSAQSTQDALTKSLRGLTSVSVFVSDIDADAIRDGLSKEQLKTTVELRLRQSAIRVVSEKPAEGSHGAVWVDVNTFRLESIRSYNYNARLHMFRNVNVVGGEQDTIADAWFTTPAMGIVSAADLAKRLRETLTNQADALANAYLSVNPKQ